MASLEPSVFLVESRKSSPYCAQLSFGSGKSRKYVRGFGSTPSEAIFRCKRNLARKLERGEALKPRPRSMTFGRWFEEWIETLRMERSVAPSTLQKYERTLRQHVLPSWCDLPLSAIGTREVRDLFFTRLSEIGRSARAHCFDYLEVCLRRAVKQGLIPASPLLSVSTRDIKSVETSVQLEDDKFIDKRVNLSRYMLKWLEDPTNPYHAHYPRILFMFLGLRRSELLGLTWDCITGLKDTNKGKVTIRQQLVHETGRGFSIAPRTKNRSARTVHLPERWRKALLQQKEMNPPGSNFVFCSRSGQPLSYNYHSQQWSKILRAYVEHDGDVFNEDDYFRPHYARHVAVSLLFYEGVAAELAMAIVGHSSEQTHAIYRHLTSKHKRDAAVSLEKGLSTK